MRQDVVSSKTGSFFGDYATQFDEIYTLQHQRGLRGWLNRSLRASMVLRFEKTFVCLQPMTGCRVLDVGCGSGRYLCECLTAGALQVTGIDLSEEMIRLAGRALRNMKEAAARAELIVGDVFTHRFSSRYDYGIVMGVMDYIEDAEGFLQRLGSLITRRVVLSFPAQESLWTWQRKARYRLRGCPLYFYSRARLQHLMQGGDFRVLAMERIARDYFVSAEPRRTPAHERGAAGAE